MPTHSLPQRQMDEWSASYIERLVPGESTHLMGGRMSGPLDNRTISSHSYSLSADAPHSAQFILFHPNHNTG